MVKSNPQTRELAKLFCRAHPELSCRWHFGMPDTLLDHDNLIPFSQIEGFLDQARKLLAGGADPSIDVRTYEYEGKKFHCLLDDHIDPEIEFFEGYANCFHSKGHLSDCRSTLRTPLVDAAYTKDMTTVELLIQHGAKVRGFRFWMRNPYMPAVSSNNLVLLNIMLQATRKEDSDLEINHWLVEGTKRALEIAARPVSDFSVVLALVKKGRQNPLSALPEYRSNFIIDHMIRHDIALPEIRKDKPEILAAAFLDHLGLCRLVVQNGADITACDVEGYNALHVAVGNKTTDVCKYLITAGADVFTKDSHHMTPLLEAVYYGHKDAIRLLLANGASIDTVMNTDTGPNSQNSRDQVCPRLQGHWRKVRNAAVERFKVQRWSAVHIAAYRGFTSVLQVLVENGADITVKDNLGCTSLDIAINHSNTTTAFWLLAQGCPFVAKTEAASRLLAQAMEECRSTVARKLFEHGVALPNGDGLRNRSFGDINWDIESLPGTTYTSAKQSTPLESLVSNEIVSLICGNCTSALEFVKVDLSPANQKPDCHLCRLIQDCVDTRHTSRLTIKYINDKGAPDRELLMESSDDRFSHPMRMISYEWHQFLQNLETLEDGNTGSLAAMSMARRWLHTCTRGHSKCNRHLTTTYSPTRVLDLAGLESGQDPKLLQDVKLDSAFAALSHRWGLEGLPITTSHNLTHRLQRVSLTDLSPTMRDAIDIVRKLDIRYLWIDALCIIQDSTEDWLREASKMSDVFSGAIVTIAVADADHHAQGIFRTRQARCTRPFPIPYLRNMPYRERIELDGEGEFYAFPKHKLLGSGNRAKGPLDSRAWILQEQLLSPRILYFGNGEIFWDCVTLSASESSPISASLLYDSDPDETWALKLLRRTLAKSTETTTLRKRIADVWTQAIKNYSARKLTRSSDRLIALQGILRPLAAILQMEPVAGMWRDQLWRQLMWWVADPPSSSEATFIAPTWSWLSAQGPVYYHNSTRTEDPLEGPGAHKFTDLELLARIVSVETETYPGATGIQGTLTIAGPSFSYHLTPNDLKKKIFKSWNAAKLNHNLGKWLLDDNLDLPRNIHCVILAEDSVAKMLVILCLAPVEYLEGYWRRVGICHWDGLAWQVPKYVGSEPEERSFTLV